MTESVHPVIAAAQRYRAQLLAQERQSASRLVDAYGRAYNRMGDSIRQLEARLSAGVDSEYYRNRADALRSLRAQVADEINKFAVYADQEITANARRAIAQGIDDSGRIVGAYFGNNPQGRQMMAASWDVLPTEAVESMLGFLAPDSPLHTRLVGILGETVAASMERNLTDAITLGFNPRKTASIVRQELGVGLTWALNTARTAQMYAYREATRANYMANSDVVSGWTWFATLAGNRTCMSCIAQHGSKHPVTETLNDHHAGRCVAIPIVPLASRIGISMPEIETGEEWFRRQPEDVQREMMGPGMFEAWQLNQFRFRDLSRPYHDPVYGTMLRQSSLRDLLNRGAPPPFGGGNRPPSGQSVPTTEDLARARLAGEQMRREQEMQRQVEAEKQRLREEREAMARETLRSQAEREAAQRHLENQRARQAEAARLGYDPDDPAQVRPRLIAVGEEYGKREAVLTESISKMYSDIPIIKNKIVRLEKNYAKRRGTPQEAQTAEAIRQYRVEQEALDKRLNDAIIERDRLRVEASEKLAPFVQVRNPARVTMSAPGVDPETRAQWQKGVDKFNSLVSADVAPARSVPFQEFSGNPHFDLRTGIVSAPAGEYTNVFVHELGHWLETNNSEVLRKEVEFFERRTKGEQSTSIYNDNMLGKRDKFIHEYIGREYVVSGVRYGTEIASMGLEYMLTEPALLAKQDPDMFDFIFNLVRGY